jgi:alkanesulfonate monooxygenase SsuD/methylene tetrahydromethanopterin reductase-like flavin-dependent oxidoreductase (luciferase family)
MELGVYSFGHVRRHSDGSLGSTAQAIRDVLEAIHLADEVGLDYFGVGEHHTRSMPISAPATVLAAAAATTRQIHLGSTVTVLGTDEPVRVYQQHAVASAISGGRVDLTAGRGSSVDSFPLFGYELDDYDRLYAEKLDLLLAINASERVTWRGTVRPSLDGALVVPRVEAKAGLKIWLGTGGNPGSSVRAGMLGLPVAYGILSGSIAHWVAQADLYREAAARAGHDDGTIDIAVASHGFVAADGADAKDRFYRYERSAFEAYGAEHGVAAQGRDRRSYDADAAPGGMIFAGDPNEIADRLISFHHQLGHSRHILQMDLGSVQQGELLQSIELLGTEVAPVVRAELGAARSDSA